MSALLASDPRGLAGTAVTAEWLEYGKACVSHDGPILPGVECCVLARSVAFPPDLLRACRPYRLGPGGHERPEGRRREVPHGFPHTTVLRPLVVGGTLRSVAYRLRRRSERGEGIPGRTYWLGRYLCAAAEAPLAAMWAGLDAAPLQGITAPERGNQGAPLSLWPPALPPSDDAQLRFVGAALELAGAGVPIGVAGPIPEAVFQAWAQALRGLLPASIRPLMSAGWGVTPAATGELGLSAAPAFLETCAVFGPDGRLIQLPTSCPGRGTQRPWHDDHTVPGRMLAWRVLGSSAPDRDEPPTAAILDDPTDGVLRQDEPRVQRALRRPGLVVLDQERVRSSAAWLAGDDDGQAGEGLHSGHCSFSTGADQLFAAALEALGDPGRRLLADRVIRGSLGSRHAQRHLAVLAQHRGPGAARAILHAALLRDDRGAVMRALAAATTAGESAGVCAELEALGSSLQHLLAEDPPDEADASSIRGLRSRDRAAIAAMLEARWRTPDADAETRQRLLGWALLLAPFPTRDPLLALLQGTPLDHSALPVLSSEVASGRVPPQLLPAVAAAALSHHDHLRASMLADPIAWRPVLSRWPPALLAALFPRMSDRWEHGTPTADDQRVADALAQFTPDRALLGSLISAHHRRGVAHRGLPLLWAWAGRQPRSHGEDLDTIDILRALHQGRLPQGPSPDPQVLDRTAWLLRVSGVARELAPQAQGLLDGARRPWQPLLVLEIFPGEDLIPSPAQLASLVPHRDALRTQLRGPVHPRRRRRLAVATQGFHATAFPGGAPGPRFDPAYVHSCLWAGFRGVPMEDQGSLAEALEAWSTDERDQAALLRAWIADVDSEDPKQRRRVVVRGVGEGLLPIAQRQGIPLLWLETAVEAMDSPVGAMERVLDRLGPRRARVVVDDDPLAPAMTPLAADTLQVAGWFQRVLEDLWHPGLLRILRRAWWAQGGERR